MSRMLAAANIKTSNACLTVDKYSFHYYDESIWSICLICKWSKGTAIAALSLKRTGDKNKENKQLGEMIVLKYLQILKTNMKRNMWDICKGKLIFSAYLRVKWLKIYEGMAVYEAEENPTMLQDAMRNYSLQK